MFVVKEIHTDLNIFIKTKIDFGKRVNMAFERIFPNCRYNDCPLLDTCTYTATRIQRSDYHTAQDPVDVLIIGDCSSLHDMISQKAFSGPEKRIIDEVITEVIPNHTVAYSHVIRGCYLDTSRVWNNENVMIKKLPAGELKRARGIGINAHPRKKMIVGLCLPFLLDDIKTLRPKLIIALGNNVKEALFPKEPKSLLQLANHYRTFQIDNLSIPVKFMSSIFSMYANPSGQKTWKNQLAAYFTNKVATADTKLGFTHILTDFNEAIEYLRGLREVENDISIDCETANLNKRYGNRIATIQFAETNNNGVVLPYNHPESPFTPEEIEKLRLELYALFNKPSKIRAWVGHNFKFECNLFASIIGTPLVSAPVYDTMIGAYLIDENRRERASDFKYGIYSLKQLAYEFVNWDGYDKGILKERAEGNLFDLKLTDLATYGAMDVYITRRLMYAQKAEASSQNYTYQLMTLMTYLYTPILLLFNTIEQNGFYVDKTSLRALVARDSILLKSINDITHKLVETPEVQRANDILLSMQNKQKIQPLGKKPFIFDFSKEKHPQTLFFNVCGLQQGMVGKSGIPSVDAKWQEQNKDHPLVQVYMEWSAMRHLYDTFAKTLYDRIDLQKDDIDCNTDSRIRPDFNLTKAVTGRIACENPNLQNIPRADTPAKKAIKNVFQAPPNHYLVQLDYKANEIRWVGILAQDENLAKAIWQGKHAMDEYRKNPSEELLKKVDTYADIHKQTAAMVFCKPIEDVTKDERQISKAVVFAILYGSTIRAVAEARGRSVQEVEGWFNQFYERFPAIANWKARMEQQAKDFGYIEAPHGRRRRLSLFDLYRDQWGRYNENLVPAEHISRINTAIRQSVNSPIQGIASDNGMCGAALFAKYIRENNMPWSICNAVHDSCVFQVPFNSKDELDKALDAAEYWFTTGVTEYMINAFNINFNLPLEIDFDIGLKWGDMIKWNFSKRELQDIKSKLTGS
jgi:DNA polymerase I-like protein with 3'-5' exonuclease and polymerase domains